MIAQAQEANDKPDPMMVAAQAEMAKAEAAINILVINKIFNFI